MTLTTTYESTLARVKLAATNLNNATFATFERSLDNITWTTVRCGTDSPVVSGSSTIYDYEFTSGLVNYYRVTSQRHPQFVAAGTASAANNASVTPTVPVGSAANDVMVLYAASRDFAATPSLPAGWTELIGLANVRLMRKVHSGAESNPTVTFSGGAAGQETIAQIFTMRNTNSTNSAFAQQFNSTAQNIAYPSMTVPENNDLIMYFGWRQDDWTSVGTLPGDGGTAVEIGEPDTAVGGNGVGIVWDYVIQTTKVNVAAGSFLVTGGTTANSRGGTMSFPGTTDTSTSSITPVIDDLWIKSVGKPFLNRTVFCTAEISDIERGPRQGIFEIIGRNYPVAVSDKHQSREGFIRVVTRTSTEQFELDQIVASGEPLFFHTPLHHQLPSMHVVLGRVVERKPLRNPQCNDLDWRVFTLPWREIAPPRSDVCGSTVIWQTVVNSYATWQAVLNGETSWLDLMNNIGTPADVIVS